MIDNFQNLAKKTLDDIFNLADKKSQDFDVDFDRYANVIAQRSAL